MGPRTGPGPRDLNFECAHQNTEDSCSISCLVALMVLDFGRVINLT